MLLWAVYFRASEDSIISRGDKCHHRCTLMSHKQKSDIFSRGDLSSVGKYLITAVLLTTSWLCLVLWNSFSIFVSATYGRIFLLFLFLFNWYPLSLNTCYSRHWTCGLVWCYRIENSMKPMPYHSFLIVFSRVASRQLSFIQISHFCDSNHVNSKSSDSMLRLIFSTGTSDFQI